MCPMTLHAIHVWPCRSSPLKTLFLLPQRPKSTAYLQEAVAKQPYITDTQTVSSEHAGREGDAEIKWNESSDVHSGTTAQGAFMPT